MFPCFGFGFGYWWIFPIIMIAMMALCFFMMRRHMGSMMCSGSHSENASGSVKQKYEKKKEDIARRT